MLEAMATRVEAIAPRTGVHRWLEKKKAKPLLVDILYIYSLTSKESLDDRNPIYPIYPRNLVHSE